VSIAFWPVLSEAIRVMNSGRVGRGQGVGKVVILGVSVGDTPVMG